MKKLLTMVVTVILVFVTLLITLFLIASLTVLFFNGFLTKDSEGENCYNDSKRVFGVNYESNETYDGYVFVNQCLENDQYISYQDDNRINHVLISNFGVGEYFCGGTCSCVTNNRRSSIVLTRGIFHLVAALTSVVAYQRAKEFFKQDCIERMSDTCATSSIESEVDSCEEIPSVPATEESKQVEEEPRDMKTFICKGNCLPKEFRRKESRELAKEFKCKKLKLELEIEIDCLKTEYGNAYALMKFNKKLVAFCRKNSLSDTWFNYSKGHGQWKEIFLCVGVKKGNLNDSMHCRQLTKYMDKRGSNALKHWKSLKK